ncbi:unnamed protein product [Pieris macdunnoughi]|uniref:Jun-like transcription factor domain-containing protein n=1 Tax=Pieris macdunnoughi TaxID=345717 RepID=A0A821NLM4_9NEOP|nr:unnamed protein product [Pieris macdunnoughi]
MVRSGHGMETTFYDEQYPLSGPVENLKRSLTLDLDFGRGKRLRNGAPVLSSPDLQLLKLGSPELEKLIMQNGMITTATPTPGGPVLFPPRGPHRRAGDVCAAIRRSARQAAPQRTRAQREDYLRRSRSPS